MSLFHTHKWTIVSTHYTPPIIGLVSYKGMFEAEMLYGATHIYAKCEKCGEIKEQRVMGRYDEHYRQGER